MFPVGDPMGYPKPATASTPVPSAMYSPSPPYTENITGEEPTLITKRPVNSHRRADDSSHPTIAVVDVFTVVTRNATKYLLTSLVGEDVNLIIPITQQNQADIGLA